MRCVANAMLLKERARGIPINLGFGANACRLMAEDGIDGEFLGSRILFLSTYAAQDHIIDLIQKHNLAGIIAQNLKRHADKPADAAPTDPLVNMALVDTLNLVFSATHVLEKSHQDMLSQFSDTIPSIVSLLLGRIIPAGKPLDQPIDKLVNALVNFNLADFNETLYPESATTNLASKLVILLDEALSVYSESQMAVMITPLATVILKMLPSAPEEARDFFKSKMLPQSSERTEVLGQGKSLSDRILKNMTNPMAPELRDLLGHITFELSDKDATKLVENIGYGFASGYLFQNKIPVPESMRDSRGDATGRPINPVTGQYVDQETVLELPQMTDEEKEREAERLFVLFERYVVPCISYVRFQLILRMGAIKTSANWCCQCGKPSYSSLSIW